MDSIDPLVSLGNLEARTWAGSGVKTDKTWRSYIRALYRAVQIHGRDRNASELLGSEDSTDVHGAEMSNHILAAASYTGNLTIAGRCLQDDCDPNHGSGCFEYPLPKAASGCFEYPLPKAASGGH